MGTTEIFQEFKESLIDKNENKYGKEARNLYGSDSVDFSNNKILNMSTEDYLYIENLSKTLNEILTKATKIGDPTSELAKELLKTHKEWLSFFMNKSISDEMQLAFARMYVTDERFKEYYDNIFPGSAEFLLEAVKHFY